MMDQNAADPCRSARGAGHAAVVGGAVGLVIGVVLASSVHGYLSRAFQDGRPTDSAASGHERTRPAPPAGSSWGDMVPYAMAFNLARGVTAGARFGPNEYVFAEGALSETRTQVHLVRWAEAPPASGALSTDGACEASAVLGASMRLTERTVTLDCPIAVAVAVLDLDANGRNEVVVWDSYYSAVVVDFTRPQGAEIVFEDAAEGKAASLFADLDGDGTYEWIRRGHAINLPIWPEAAHTMGSAVPLDGQDDVCMIYALDASTRARRPSWIDAALGEADLRIGRRPIEYELVAVTRQLPSVRTYSARSCTLATSQTGARDE